jgi:hypothetical protein
VHARAVVRTRFLRRGGGSVENEDLRALAGDPPDGREVPAWVQGWTDATRVGSDVARPVTAD